MSDSQPNNQKVINALKTMKLLNKAQLISKELHKLNPEQSYLQSFDKSIFELALTPTDIIGDNAFFEVLKKHKIKMIREAHETGWYQVTERRTSQ